METWPVMFVEIYASYKKQISIISLFSKIMLLIHLLVKYNKQSLRAVTTDGGIGGHGSSEVITCPTTIGRLVLELSVARNAGNLTPV